MEIFGIMVDILRWERSGNLIWKWTFFIYLNISHIKPNMDKQLRGYKARRGNKYASHPTNVEMENVHLT